MIHTVRNGLHNLSRRLLTLGIQGILLSVLVVVVVALFVIPLPPPILDVLLVVNLVIALTLLLRGLFIRDPMHLFSFPVVLLLTTLYRLALNVSSTRLILLNGDQGLQAAGRVIQSFGEFVVQNNFVVGAIIFAVIAIVNFVVIAKGSARVAEVSARFTLDALPGKQLSIDSDLRAGNITKEEAARRRDDLFREAQFFGAMDGAMKFVQGDAIAGFVITFVNAIGGVSLGVSRGMAFDEAIDTFGILTIGDGLVSILPSLLISVCAGAIVTHVAGREERGTSGEIFVQLISEPRALAIAAFALLCISLVPGFPFFPFFIVSALALVLLGRKSLTCFHEEAASPDSIDSRYVFASSSATGLAHFGVDALRERGETDHFVMTGQDSPSAFASLRLELSDSSVDRNSDEGGIEPQRILDSLAQARMRVFKQRGIMLPEVYVSESKSVDPGMYRILVREQFVQSGVVKTDCVFVVAGMSVLNILGIEPKAVASHPVNHRLSAWVKRDDTGLSSLRHLGIEILDPYEYLALAVVGGAFEVIDEIFGLGEIQAMLEEVKERYPHLVDEVFNKELLSYSEFAEILRRLVRESVNVRDLKVILEGISEFFSSSESFEDRHDCLQELHVFLRIVLSRRIVADVVGPGDKLRLFELSAEVEQEFRAVLPLWENSRSKPPLDPAFEISLRNRAEKVFHPVLERGVLPVVVVCSSDVRPAVQEFFRRQTSNPGWIRAIAYQELNDCYQPESIGVIGIEN